MLIEIISICVYLNSTNNDFFNKQLTACEQMQKLLI